MTNYFTHDTPYLGEVPWFTHIAIYVDSHSSNISVIDHTKPYPSIYDWSVESVVEHMLCAANSKQTKIKLKNIVYLLNGFPLISGQN